jgi:hemolysin III
MTAAASAPVLDRHGNPKPRLRGWIHRFASFVALPAAILLVVLAPTARARIACAIYGLTLAGLFTISSMYHIGNWTDSQRSWWRRADHSMIFLLIAGTYTPFALLVLDGALATAILVAVWGGALAGIVLNLVWIDAPKWLTAVVYVALGWVAVIAFPGLFDNLGVTPTMLIALGGVLYTIGAVVYAVGKPDPVPAVFGYHEVFHALVIAAAAVQYGVVAFYVL